MSSESVREIYDPWPHTAVSHLMEWIYGEEQNKPEQFEYVRQLLGVLAANNLFVVDYTHSSGPVRDQLDEMCEITGFDPPISPESERDRVRVSRDDVDRIEHLIWGGSGSADERRELIAKLREVTDGRD